MKSIFQQIFNNPLIGIAVIDSHGDILQVNNKLCNLLGYVEEELIHNPLTQFLHTEDMDEFWANFTQLRNAEITQYQIEKRCLHKNGSHVWLEFRSSIGEETGSGQKFIIFFEDNSERRKLVRELVKHKTRFQGIFDNTLQFIGLLEVDGTVLEANKSSVEFSGCKKEEILGKKLWETIWWSKDEEGKRKLTESIEKAAQGTFIRYDCEVYGKSGFEIIDFSLRPILNEEGKVFLLIPEGRIISDRIALQKRLENKTRLLEATEQLSNNGSWEWQVPNDRLIWSKSTYAVFEKQPLEEGHLSVQDYVDFVHENDIERIRDAVQSTVDTGAEFNVKHRIRVGDKIKHIHVKGEAVRGREGNVELVRGAVRDNTEELRSSRAMMNYNEMLEKKNEELKQFAYVASHDLQEPLRTITSFIQLLRLEMGEIENEEIEKYLEIIENGSTRMKGLISDLLSFSSLENTNLKIELTDLNSLVNDLVSDLATSISESGAKIIIEKDLPTLECDSRRMSILFQNLISNAIKFKREGESPIIQLQWEKADMGIVFKVIDNGIGINEGYILSVFEPFRRLHSREEYDGNGIGLALCQRIVRQHKGKIWVESVFGEGSTFCFLIPTSENSNDVRGNY